MKIRILDRILAALAGLILLCAGAALIAQMFFGADLVGFAGRILASPSVGRRLILAAVAAGLLLLGLYSVMVLFRHRKKKDRFVRQKTENGELAISMKVLEQMVRRCLAQHPEMEVRALDLETRRDGLAIRIQSKASGGISIPLTAEALQKEIKQYVTACSGVEISGVRLEIETSEGEAADAPFAIPAPKVPRLPRETEQPDREAEKPAEEPETVPAAPAEQPETVPEAPAAQAEPEILSAALLTPDEIVPEEEEDDRPMHQRLFSAQPEPCIIPEPPAETDEVKGPDPAEETSPGAESADAQELALSEPGDKAPAEENGEAADEENSGDSGPEKTPPTDGEEIPEENE